MGKLIKNNFSNFLAILLIVILLIAWVYNYPPVPFLKNFGGQGWPSIWNNPSFPPKIQEARAMALISYITNCTGTSSCTAANTAGDLEIAYAGRNSSATAPSLASGWTSMGTASINGTSSADSAVRMACKVTTSNSEASGTFTNAGTLIIQVYRGQLSGATAVCASTILGAPSFWTSTINTTTVTETFNSLSNQNMSSWDVGFGYCSACTAGINTAPTGMLNRSSITGPPGTGGHDTNGYVSSFTGSNVTLTTAGRIITGVVEIKASIVDTPAYDMGTGTYNNDVSVTITVANPSGATICYTTDGSTPAATTPGTCSTGTTYSVAVSITATGTVLKAIGTKAGYTNSAVQSATYTLTVGAITSSPGAGTYGSAQTVTLNIATTTGATAYYTTDGSAVTCSSTTYTGGFLVSVTTTVKAIGCKTNYNSDTAISDLYTININATPTVTLNYFPNDGAVGGNITLLEGTTTQVSVSATITDTDTYSDIKSAKAYVLRHSLDCGSSGCSALEDVASCSDYNENCLAKVECQLDTNSGSGNNINCTASPSLYWFATPTDSGASAASDDWMVMVVASDAAGAGAGGNYNDGVVSNSGSLVDVNTLSALDVSTSVNFGTLLPGNNTGSSPIGSGVENTGNKHIDVFVKSTDFYSLCIAGPQCGATAIAVDQEVYSSASLPYSDDFIKTLSATNTEYNICLPKATNENNRVNDTLFWGLAIPLGKAVGTYTGQNTLTATGGDASGSAQEVRDRAGTECI